MSSDFISRRNGRRQRRAAYRPMSEINVTPFVDVMLVLLIVFMITAPLLTVGVPVDLPKTKAQPLSQPEEPLVISVNAEGEIYVQEPGNLGSLGRPGAAADRDHREQRGHPDLPARRPHNRLRPYDAGHGPRECCRLPPGGPASAGWR
jgi:biopolymer transport protein ExbD